MKKQLLIGALSFAAILFLNTSVKAQTANVTINLSDVISVNPGSSAGNSDGSGDVLFEYEDDAAYKADQTVEKPNHLIITSTKAFDVKVQAGGTTFVGSGTAAGSTIPVDVLTLKVNASSDVGGTPSDVELDGTLQTLITEAPIGSEKKVDIDYFIPKEKSSSTDILGKPAGDYAQTVTYTITAH
jgi:hypothetical protein